MAQRVIRRRPNGGFRLVGAENQVGHVKQAQMPPRPRKIRRRAIILPERTRLVFGNFRLQVEDERRTRRRLMIDAFERGASAKKRQRLERAGTAEHVMLFGMLEHDARVLKRAAQRAVNLRENRIRGLGLEAAIIPARPV